MYVRGSIDTFWKLFKLAKDVSSSFRRCILESELLVELAKLPCLFVVGYEASDLFSFSIWRKSKSRLPCNETNRYSYNFSIASRSCLNKIWNSLTEIRRSLHRIFLRDPFTDDTWKRRVLRCAISFGLFTITVKIKACDRNSFFSTTKFHLSPPVKFTCGIYSDACCINVRGKASTLNTYAWWRAKASSRIKFTCDLSWNSVIS